MSAEHAYPPFPASGQPLVVHDCPTCHCCEFVVVGKLVKMPFSDYASAKYYIYTLTKDELPAKLRHRFGAGYMTLVSRE